MVKKKETVIGALGIILSILGVIWTIPLSLKGTPYTYGIILTSSMVIIGILLIAWAFGD